MILSTVGTTTPPPPHPTGDERSEALDATGVRRQPAEHPPDQVAGLEKAGLDTIWVAEPYGFDAPTLMGYLAAKTETVEIGAAILNVYSRTQAPCCRRWPVWTTSPVAGP